MLTFSLGFLVGIAFLRFIEREESQWRGGGE